MIKSENAASLQSRFRSHHYFSVECITMVYITGFSHQCGFKRAFSHSFKMQNSSHSLHLINTSTLAWNLERPHLCWSFDRTDQSDLHSTAEVEHSDSCVPSYVLGKLHSTINSCSANNRSDRMGPKIIDAFICIGSRDCVKFLIRRL